MKWIESKRVGAEIIIELLKDIKEIEDSDIYNWVLENIEKYSVFQFWKGFQALKKGQPFEVPEVYDFQIDDDPPITADKLGGYFNKMFCKKLGVNNLSDYLLKT